MYTLFLQESLALYNNYKIILLISDALMYNFAMQGIPAICIIDFQVPISIETALLVRLVQPLLFVQILKLSLFVQFLASSLIVKLLHSPLLVQLLEISLLT